MAPSSLLILSLQSYTPAVCAAPGEEPQALALDLYQVQRQDTVGGIDIAGTVAALKTASLTAQIPGRVARIAGREGARFQRGDELIQIDDTALRARLDAAFASRNAALAAMRNANVQLHRELNSPQSEASTNAPGGMGLPAMMDQVFTSPMQNVMGMRSNNSERFSDVIGRETQLAQADTQYRQAEAQIKEIEASLRDARTIAPFDGVIETLHVELGDTMQPGQPLLTFSETNIFQKRTWVWPARQPKHSSIRRSPRCCSWPCWPWASWA